MKYYTADLHLGHSNVIKFDNRPFKNVDEMDRALIDNWNSRVTNNDQIYIVGDLIYKSGKDPELYLKQLRGQKFLVIGNHDKDVLKYAKYFVAIDKMMHVTDGNNQICLCHFPIVEWNGYFKGHYHIYGHIHNHKNRAYEVMSKEPKAFNVGCMLHDYMPVTFNELIKKNEV